MSLVTISSIAAFEGAQTMILRLFLIDEFSMEIIPLMVWVFPVPAISETGQVKTKQVLTWSLNKKEVYIIHVLNLQQGLLLALIELGLMFVNKL